LYFGSLFLLMAMITMVAHAHQRLDHVWPWWAFGIGLGIAILVMFGLFEKKKNEMKAIAGRFKEWET
jgi:Na+-driven multidrug efflux pump